jgi:hypothetical protein
LPQGVAAGQLDLQVVTSMTDLGGEPHGRARTYAKRRRFAPLALAIIATAAAIALAVGPSPRGPYDRSLAVLTATLVAVIWYTYFAFLGVFRRKPTHLDLALEYEPQSKALRPLVRNLGDNRVRLRIELGAFWDALVAIPFDDFYEGREDVPLEPHSGIGGWIELGAPQGPMLVVRMRVSWWDDAGYEGATEPRHWLIEIDQGRISAVIGSKNIATLFGDAERGLGTGATVQPTKT